jgi:peptide deformylase
MALLPIVVYPNDVLRKPTQKVDRVTDEVRKIIDDMRETMFHSDGVGLAANQVGISKQILLAAPQGEEGPVYVYLNPEILSQKGEVLGPEGCLSLPGVAAEVKRAQEITVSFLNMDGKIEKQKLTDFHARIIQHEMDHLAGKLLIDRVGMKQRSEILEKYKGSIQMI